jgi:DNA-directed RNA polymerase specialized sigma24 family protein
MNGFSEPEDLVDATFDRAIRRIEEVEVRDLPAFIRGVARHVASEAHKSKVRQVALDEVLGTVSGSRPTNDSDERATAERRFHCLERCSSQLCQADRELMAEFYRFDGGQKIENKKKIAETLGIALGALRVRAFRVREKLERCMTQCMRGGSAS